MSFAGVCMCVARLVKCLFLVLRVPVRQYFQEGFYPSGEASKDGEFAKDLWGSTVKAVLIAGATPLADAQKGGRLGTSEGYGSLILNRVLPFKDDNQIDLLVIQVDLSHVSRMLVFSWFNLFCFWSIWQPLDSAHDTCVFLSRIQFLRVSLTSNLSRWNRTKSR